MEMQARERHSPQATAHTSIDELPSVPKGLDTLDRILPVLSDLSTNAISFMNDTQDPDAVDEVMAAMVDAYDTKGASERLNGSGVEISCTNVDNFDAEVAREGLHGELDDTESSGGEIDDEIAAEIANEELDYITAAEKLDQTLNEADAEKAQETEPQAPHRDMQSDAIQAHSVPVSVLSTQSNLDYQLPDPGTAISEQNPLCVSNRDASGPDTVIAQQSAQMTQLQSQPMAETTLVSEPQTEPPLAPQPAPAPAPAPEIAPAQQPEPEVAPAQQPEPEPAPAPAPQPKPTQAVQSVTQKPSYMKHVEANKTPTRVYGKTNVAGKTTNVALSTPPCNSTQDKPAAIQHAPQTVRPSAHRATTKQHSGTSDAAFAADLRKKMTKLGKLGANVSPALITDQKTTHQAASDPLSKTARDKSASVPVQTNMSRQNTAFASDVRRLVPQAETATAYISPTADHATNSYRCIGINASPIENDRQLAAIDQMHKPPPSTRLEQRVPESGLISTISGYLGLAPVEQPIELSSSKTSKQVRELKVRLSMDDPLLSVESRRAHQLFVQGAGLSDLKAAGVKAKHLLDIGVDYSTFETAGMGLRDLLFLDATWNEIVAMGFQPMHIVYELGFSTADFGVLKETVVSLSQRGFNRGHSTHMREPPYNYAHALKACPEDLRFLFGEAATKPVVKPSAFALPTNDAAKTSNRGYLEINKRVQQPPSSVSKRTTAHQPTRFKF